VKHLRIINEVMQMANKFYSISAIFFLIRIVAQSKKHQLQNERQVLNGKITDSDLLK
jgi:hypothetical protein